MEKLYFEIPSIARKEDAIDYIREFHEYQSDINEDDMSYLNNSQNRKIRIYESIDSRFILDDLYAKLQLFTLE